MGDTPSDASEVKIQKSHNATVQNIVLGGLLTSAYISAPLVGIHDFNTSLYVGSMLAGFGIVNLPAIVGRAAGSVGGFSMLGFSAKYILAVIITRINNNV